MNDKISRERFLKMTALAGAGLLVSSLESWAVATHATNWDKKGNVPAGTGQVWMATIWRIPG